MAKTSQVIVAASSLAVLAAATLHGFYGLGASGRPHAAHPVAPDAPESTAGSAQVAAARPQHMASDRNGPSTARDDIRESDVAATTVARGTTRGIRGRPSRWTSEDPDADRLVATRDAGVSGIQPGGNGKAGRRAQANVSEEAAVMPSGNGGVTYGAGEDARFSTDSRFLLPESGDISGPAGTISFLFEPGWSGDNQADASLVEVGDHRLVIRKNVSFLRFEITDDSGNETGTGYSLAEWEPGQAYHITASWGAGVISLYVDGTLAAQKRYSNPFEIPSGTAIYIGTGPQDAPVAPGYVSQLQLFREALAPDDMVARPALESPKTN